MAGLGIALMMGAWPALNMQIKLCLWQDHRGNSRRHPLSVLCPAIQKIPFFGTLWRNRLAKVVSVKDIHVFDGPHASAISSSLSVRFGKNG